MLSKVFTPMQRRVLTQLNADRTPAELARSYGVTRSAIYKRTYRARKRLRNADLFLPSANARPIAMLSA